MATAGHWLKQRSTAALFEYWLASKESSAAQSQQQQQTSFATLSYRLSSIRIRSWYLAAICKRYVELQGNGEGEPKDASWMHCGWLCMRLSYSIVRLWDRVVASHGRED